GAPKKLNSLKLMYCTPPQLLNTLIRMYRTDGRSGEKENSCPAWASSMSSLLVCPTGKPEGFGISQSISLVQPSQPSVVGLSALPQTSHLRRSPPEYVKL